MREYGKISVIEWQAEGVELPALDYSAIEEWLGRVAHKFAKEIGRLTYLFCDDEYILRVNQEFLQHDYFTDIITFDYSSAERISGDMVISLDTVRSNAAGIGADFSQELLRVIVHGVLHLCGIEDKGPGQRCIMEQQEDAALDDLKNVSRGTID